LARAIPALLLCSALVTQGALASDKTPPGYTEAIAHGLMELDASNYPEAREEFRRAHEIFPNARTLRSLGMVEFELRNYAESARWLEEALSSDVKSLDGKLRSDTEELLKRAQRYLGELHVKLDPESAQLFVDGARTKLNADHVLRLQVGSHALEARAPNRLNERRTVEVVGERRSEVEISLAEPPAGGSPGSGSTTGERGPSAEAQPVYKKWWLWTTIAVVAAGGGIAAALLLTREKQKPEAQAGTNTIGVSVHSLGRF
jgi:hypothetical protein